MTDAVDQHHQDMVSIRKELTGIRTQFSDMDKRVSILEEKRKSDSSRTQELKTEVSNLSKDIKTLVNQVHEGNRHLESKITEHMANELKDRLQIARSQKATFILVALTLGSALLPYLFSYFRS